MNNCFQNKSNEVFGVFLQRIYKRSVTQKGDLKKWSVSNGYNKYLLGKVNVQRAKKPPGHFCWYYHEPAERHRQGAIPEVEEDGFNVIQSFLFEVKQLVDNKNLTLPAPHIINPY